MCPFLFPVCTECYPLPILICHQAQGCSTPSARWSSGAANAVLAVLDDAGPCQSCRLVYALLACLPVRLLFLPLALATLCLVSVCFSASPRLPPSRILASCMTPIPISTPLSPCLPFLSYCSTCFLLLPYSNFLSRVPDQDLLPSPSFFVPLFCAPVLATFVSVRRRLTPPLPSLPPSSDVLTRQDPDRVRGKEQKETFGLARLAWLMPLRFVGCAAYRGILSFLSLSLLYIRPSPVVLSSVFFSSSTQASFGFSLPIFSHSFFRGEFLLLFFLPL